MPFITPKKTSELSPRCSTATPAFVWDAFPPPPPEAETWQPDPDSIARPGDLPDPRFNRDPEHDRRSKSFRKEAKMYAVTQQQSQMPSSPSISGNLLGRGIGEWPAAAPRSTGYPRNLVQSSVTPSSPASPVKEHVQISRPKLAATKPIARVAGPPKGTMESMFVPHSRLPETPVPSRASTSSASPAKSQPPAWAAAIEESIQEDARKDASAASTKSPRPESIRKKSIPPHLRAKTDATIKSTHLESILVSLNPNAKVCETPVKQEETVQDEVDILEDNIVAWQVAMEIPGIQNSKDGLRVQQELLDRYIVNNQLPPPSPTAASATTIANSAHIDHVTKIKVLLIRAMEHEMDLEKVAPERELMVMQRAELDNYHTKVCSAHKQWWNAMGPG
ncbi:hypothetical protein BKA58DRAFT_92390 [Alternaria rosae]|uniref:uncharacterized protein n=1 Tax=Alternaria rosae TaxID=1187941 RepID=UPI001E8E5329|nr:uncharacterized protein BKA58DRAFT_92390 [Alternaria rosae]KAH6878274.1 hypothetical protein BKA58DRAFT_92390 [Alternaria rosae]